MNTRQSIKSYIIAMEAKLFGKKVVKATGPIIGTRPLLIVTDEPLAPPGKSD